MVRDEHAGRSIPPSGTAGANRLGQRRACRLAARAISGGREYQCQIVNLSSGGIALEVDTIVFFKIGSRLRVTCRELGELVCLVRWGAHPRYGAEFEAGANYLAVISHYYDSLIPEDLQRHPEVANS